MRIQATKFIALLVALGLLLTSTAGNRPWEMVAPPLATAMPSPAYDQHSQFLAVGNGVASSSDNRDQHSQFLAVGNGVASPSDNHALRVEEASETDVLTALKETILRVARSAGLTPPVITAPATPVPAVAPEEAALVAAGMEELRRSLATEFHRAFFGDWRKTSRPPTENIQGGELRAQLLSTGEFQPGVEIPKGFVLGEEPILLSELRQGEAVRIPLNITQDAVFVSKEFYPCVACFAIGQDESNVPWLVKWHYSIDGTGYETTKGHLNKLRELLPTLIQGLRNVRVLLMPYENVAGYLDPSELRTEWGPNVVSVAVQPRSFDRSAWRTTQISTVVRVKEKAIGFLIHSGDLTSAIGPFGSGAPTIEELISYQHHFRVLPFDQLTQGVLPTLSAHEPLGTPAAGLEEPTIQVAVPYQYRWRIGEFGELWLGQARATRLERFERLFLQDLNGHPEGEIQPVSPGGLPDALAQWRSEHDLTRERVGTSIEWIRRLHPYNSKRYVSLSDLPTVRAFLEQHPEAPFYLFGVREDLSPVGSFKIRQYMDGFRVEVLGGQPLQVNFPGGDMYSSGNAIQGAVETEDFLRKKGLLPDNFQITMVAMPYLKAKKKRIIDGFMQRGLIDKIVSPPEIAEAYRRALRADEVQDPYKDIPVDEEALDDINGLLRLLEWWSHMRGRYHIYASNSISAVVGGTSMYEDLRQAFVGDHDGMVRLLEQTLPESLSENIALLKAVPDLILMPAGGGGPLVGLALRALMYGDFAKIVGMMPTIRTASIAEGLGIQMVQEIARNGTRLFGSNRLQLTEVPERATIRTLVELHDAGIEVEPSSVISVAQVFHWMANRPQVFSEFYERNGRPMAIGAILTGHNFEAEDVAWARGKDNELRLDDLNNLKIVAAGLEERPESVLITKQYAVEHAQELADIETGEPVWDKEGHWGPKRFKMDVRPSTQTPLVDLWQLSFAVEDSGGIPAGYIYATNGQPDYLVNKKYPGIFIFRLSVRPDQKGNKLGHLLLLASARAARQAGIGPYVTLETDKENSRARYVYESVGFEKVGERVDEGKGVTFVDYAVPVKTLIKRAEAAVNQRYAAGLEEEMTVGQAREMNRQILNILGGNHELSEFLTKPDREALDGFSSRFRQQVPRAMKRGRSPVPAARARETLELLRKRLKSYRTGDITLEHLPRLQRILIRYGAITENVAILSAPNEKNLRTFTERFWDATGHGRIRLQVRGSLRDRLRKKLATRAGSDTLDLSDQAFKQAFRDIEILIRELPDYKQLVRGLAQPAERPQPEADDKRKSEPSFKELAAVWVQKSAELVETLIGMPGSHLVGKSTRIQVSDRAPQGIGRPGKLKGGSSRFPLSTLRARLSNAPELVLTVKEWDKRSGQLKLQVQQVVQSGGTGGLNKAKVQDRIDALNVLMEEPDHLKVLLQPPAAGLEESFRLIRLSDDYKGLVDAGPEEEFSRDQVLDIVRGYIFQGEQAAVYLTYPYVLQSAGVGTLDVSVLSNETVEFTPKESPTSANEGKPWRDVELALNRVAMIYGTGYRVLEVPQPGNTVQLYIEPHFDESIREGVATLLDLAEREGLRTALEIIPDEQVLDDLIDNRQYDRVGDFVDVVEGAKGSILGYPHPMGLILNVKLNAQFQPAAGLEEVDWQTVEKMLGRFWQAVEKGRALGEYPPEMVKRLEVVREAHSAKDFSALVEGMLFLQWRGERYISDDPALFYQPNWLILGTAIDLTWEQLRPLGQIPDWIFEAWRQVLNYEFLAWRVDVNEFPEGQPIRDAIATGDSEFVRALLHKSIDEVSTVRLPSAVVVSEESVEAEEVREDLLGFLRRVLEALPAAGLEEGEELGRLLLVTDHPGHRTFWQEQAESWNSRMEIRLATSLIETQQQLQQWLQGGHRPDGVLLDLIEENPAEVNAFIRLRLNPSGQNQDFPVALGMRGSPGDLEEFSGHGVVVTFDHTQWLTEEHAVSVFQALEAYSAAGLEEELDDLLKRFPRLVAPQLAGFKTALTQDDPSQLRAYYDNLFYRTELVNAGITIDVVSQVLESLEDAEADLARHLPGFPTPPFTSVRLLNDTHAGFIARVRGMTRDLEINLSPNHGPETHYVDWLLAVSPYILRHELGEVIQSEQKRSLSGQMYVSIPPSSVVQYSPGIERELWETKWGHGFDDMVADTIALRLASDRPESLNALLNGLRTEHERQSQNNAAAVANTLVPGMSFQTQLVGVLGSMLSFSAASQVMAEHLGDTTRGQRDAQSAQTILTALEADPSPVYPGAKWREAYEGSFLADYRKVVSAVQFVAADQGDTAGLEEGGETESRRQKAESRETATRSAISAEPPAEQAQKMIQELAEGWKLTNPKEHHVVAVSSLVRKTNSFLNSLLDRPISIGNITLVAVPEEEGQMEDLLIDLDIKSGRRETIVQGYGSQKEDDRLTLFLLIARRMELKARKLTFQEDQTFRVYFQQMVFNLSGVRPTANELVTLERLLARLRAA